MSRSRVKATYDDVLRLPEHVVCEIVGGELFVSPRAASPHAVASSGLMTQVGGPFHRVRMTKADLGAGGSCSEPEFHFGEDVLVPDLAGWRHERMQRIPRVPLFEIAPDWLCEVLSPSTASLDRSRRLRVYARERVGHVWLLDPLDRTLEVFRLNGEGPVRLAHGVRAG